MNIATETCSVRDCVKPLHARGLCKTHYGRAWREGSVHKYAKKYELGVCDLEGCDAKRHGKGLCKRHYTQKYRGIIPFQYKLCQHCGTEINDRTSYANLHEWCVSDRWRDQYYRRRYSISLDRYKEICTYQNNRCAICGVKPEVLNVDHDHVSNGVRGLLCDNCNRGLGCYKDLTEILQSGIDYLRMPPTMRMACGQRWGY